MIAYRNIESSFQTIDVSFKIFSFELVLLTELCSLLTSSYFMQNFMQFAEFWSHEEPLTHFLQDLSLVQNSKGE